VKAPLDVERCMRASEAITVVGIPRGAVRERALEEAIATIQKDGGGAFANRYIGVKQYASFGDQREDHDYGRGPGHGVIVFSIGRTSSFRARGTTGLGPDHVYFLEAVRDFGEVIGRDKRGLNLDQVLRQLVEARYLINQIQTVLAAARVDSHEAGE
jgi:hypothetical protein